MNLKDKVALVTGASKGIGRSVAIGLSQEGVNVILNYKGDRDSASQVLNECNKHSKNNFLIQADVSNENEVSEMFKKISDKYKILDILVNNAGIYAESADPNDLKMFEQIYQTNLLGQIRITGEFLKYCQTGRL